MEDDLTDFEAWTSHDPIRRRHQLAVLGTLGALHDIVHLSMRSYVAPYLGLRRDVRAWAQIWRANARQRAEAKRRR